MTDAMTTITVADAYKSSMHRSEYLVYTDWNRRAHPVMDIRPANSAMTVYEIWCADGNLDRVEADELLTVMPKRQHTKENP